MPKEPDEPLKYPLGDEISAAVAEDLESFDLDAAEEDSEEAFRSGTDMPSSGLLSFYDRVREKVLKAVEGKGGRGGKVGEGALKAILLVPDVFILLARLSLRRRPGALRPQALERPGGRPGGAPGHHRERPGPPRAEPLRPPAQAALPARDQHRLIPVLPKNLEGKSSRRVDLAPARSSS
jgi:hypothetical protein